MTNKLVNVSDKANSKQFNFKFSRRKTKADVILFIMHDLKSINRIKYLRFKATCKYGKFANSYYNALADLWEKLEDEGYFANMKQVISDELINPDEYYCLGFEVFIRDGNIFMLQYLT